MKKKTYRKYVEFLCDLLVIAIPDIYFKKSGKYFDLDCKKVKAFKIKKCAKATSIPMFNKIYVNLDIIDEKFEIYGVLAHEIRHFAQFYAACGEKGFASPEIVEEFRDDMRHYNGCENKDYQNQSMEMDANVFAWYILYSMNISLALPSVDDESRYQRYLDSIVSYFPMNDVLDSMNYIGFEFEHDEN